MAQSLKLEQFSVLSVTFFSLVVNYLTLDTRLSIFCIFIYIFFYVHKTRLAVSQSSQVHVVFWWNWEEVYMIKF